jgi:hypothetical protein
VAEANITSSFEGRRGVNPFRFGDHPITASAGISVEIERHRLVVFDASASKTPATK